MKKRVKILLRIINILSLMVFVLSICVFGYVVYCKINAKTPQFFGYSFHFVVSNSMEPDIMTGDFVLGKSISLDELYNMNNEREESDKSVILFYSIDPSIEGRVVVHKIREIIKTSEGYNIYTYGINNEEDDFFEAGEIIGIVIFSSSFLGKIFNPYTILFVIVLMILGVFAFHSARAFLKNYNEYKNIK